MREARACLEAEADIVAVVDALAATPGEFDELASALEACEIEELP